MFYIFWIFACLCFRLEKKAEQQNANQTGENYEHDHTQFSKPDHRE